MNILVFHIPLIFAEVGIPVIVVFTKYDLLVSVHYRACSHISFRPDRIVEATNRANRAFRDFTKELKVPFAPVSMKKGIEKEYGGQLIIISITSLLLFKLTATAGTMFVELTRVTEENLRGVEGSLWAVWATAQQINAREKVEISIRCVFPR